MNPLAEIIRTRLATLSPQQFTLQDDSAKHIGHVGAAGGGGHYQLHIVSPLFEGKTLLARHRLVYAQLGELIPQQIHALAINAQTPAEYAANPPNRNN